MGEPRQGTAPGEGRAGNPAASEAADAAKEAARIEAGRRLFARPWEFLQMRLNPTPPDPTQRIIFTWMPLIFTFMLASFPAGLVIYWAWNNLLSVTQQYVIMRRQGVEVNLWGNIRETFKRSPKPAPVADTKALPKPANDSTPPDTRTAAARAKAKKAQKAKNKPTGAEAKG